MTKKIVQIQSNVFMWHKEYGRHDLPWRASTCSEYDILIAEIMLQQTNVPKVIEKFKMFVTLFPTIFSLAKASQKEVVTAWQGLGYNRRAIYVHKMAKNVVKNYKGVLPKNIEQLQELPGIGPYTSCSFLIFAYNQNIVTWDVNIERIMRRLHNKYSKISNDQMKSWCLLFLPQNDSCRWHNALMDFASDICTKKTPSCNICPLSGLCKSYPCSGDEKIKKRKEIGRIENGKYIPRRIYRGRIVNFLRHAQEARVSEIGYEIKKDWSEKDRKWCIELLNILKKEKMITNKNNKWMLQE